VQVGTSLNRFMTRTAHLPAHITAIQHYLLLGRGDLFRDFLEASGDLLHTAPRPSTASHDLQRPFAAAAIKARLDSCPFFSYVSIAWLPSLPPLQTASNQATIIPAFTAVLAGVPSWNTVQLTYTPPWPLPLLLDATSLAIYSALSSYLLAVERAQRSLDETWLHLMTQRRASRRGGVPPEWRLQHRMAHFLRHVHQYLKEDVVKRSCEGMLSELASADTFEQVQRAHRQLLDKLKAQTFLSHPAVCEKLQAVLQQCNLLSRRAPSSHSGDSNSLHAFVLIAPFVLVEVDACHQVSYGKQRSCPCADSKVGSYLARFPMCCRACQSPEELPQAAIEAYAVVPLVRGNL
jgi:hypothetical protein